VHKARNRVSKIRRHAHHGRGILAGAVPNVRGHGCRADQYESSQHNKVSKRDSNIESRALACVRIKGDTPDVKLIT
jgi:hypothetical protein